jgi:hypothetical protein
MLFADYRDFIKFDEIVLSNSIKTDQIIRLPNRLPFNFQKHQIIDNKAIAEKLTDPSIPLKENQISSEFGYTRLVTAVFY